MVQEVQTWIWITNETTLETIQAVWTSSVKIREGRQTIKKFKSGASVSGSISWTYHNDGSRQSDRVQCKNLSITSYYWDESFYIRDYWVYIPSLWTYEVYVDWYWATSQRNVSLKLEVDGKILYTKTLNAWNPTDKNTILLNLWKYNCVKVWGQFYYWGSNTAATGSLPINQISFKQL